MEMSGKMVMSGNFAFLEMSGNFAFLEMSVIFFYYLTKIPKSPNQCEKKYEISKLTQN